MYTAFFGLGEKPFAITPDPRYLFLSERHAEALAHLLYGINESGGFIQLTGEVGTGKTTIVRSLLGQIPKDAEVALILNTRITPAEFLLTICEELRVTVAEGDRNSVKALVDALNRHLLEAHSQGRRVVVIVDEAQNLSIEVLEQVRLLTNLETATQKLLQIILIGQPELREVLQRVELRQLAQRITGRYHLSPLTRRETAGYIQHRLRVAGATGEVFTKGALAEVHRLSRGIPRIINVVSDRALLGAYTQEEHRITGKLVRRSVSEVYGRPVMPLWTRWAGAAAVVLTAGMLAVGGWQYFRTAGSSSVAANSAAAPPGSAQPATAKGAAAGAPGVAAAAAAPALPSITETLSAHSGETNLDAAFSKLFALWGASYRPGGTDACDQAVQQGLECVMQRGSWGQLRALNRPAILMLNDDAGIEHQLVLSQLDDQHAAVELGGKHEPVSIVEISKYWYGDYMLLWRPRVAGGKELSMGMRGDDVGWLRHSLEKVRGLEPSTDGADVYDERLARLVQDFQREHRLTIDGIAGMQTQIALDTALADPNTPFLRAPPAPGG
ncbi:MAG TPA: AAA family ATPase [Steroidobacteraceae bacterium]|nr:AAA family ATPase [Steroidobacteraceae bacterium]